MAGSKFSRADARPARLYGATAPAEEDDDGENEELSTEAIVRLSTRDKSVPYLHYYPERFRLYAALLLSAYSVEEYVMRPDLFGLETASPLQRAVCRVIAGYPLDGSRNPVTEWPAPLERLFSQTADDTTGGRGEALTRLRDEYDARLAVVGEDLTIYPEVAEAFGGELPTSTDVKEVMVIAAIRCAKTFIAAAAVAQRSIVADLTGLQPGETARAGIISWRVDLANTCFEFVTNAFEGSQLLRALLVKKPAWYPGAPTNLLRLHNVGSDRFVDILILTANRGGASALSKWYVAFVVDEAARMLADYNDGVINYADIRRAVVHRIRKDGLFLTITSPWYSVGPVYEAAKHLGMRPEKRACVLWAPGWAMNPITWTPEACEAAKLADPDAYETDVAARFARTDELAISHKLMVAASTLPVVHAGEILPNAVPPKYAGEVAILDASLRKDAISFCIAAMVRGRRTILVYREWVGTPEVAIDTKRVAREVAAWMRRFQVTDLEADRLSQESMGELLEHDAALGVTTWEASASDFAVMAARVEHHLKMGELVLPDDERIRDDLSGLRRISTHAGDIQIAFPTSLSIRQSVSARVILLAIERLYKVEVEQTIAETEETRMHAAMLRRHGPRDPLGAMDRAVDDALERYDATGDLFNG